MKMGITRGAATQQEVSLRNQKQLQGKDCKVWVLWLTGIVRKALRNKSKKATENLWQCWYLLGWRNR